MKTRKRGKEKETLAVSFLQQQGAEILERNFRSPWGEIDIIARDKGVLAFIEVKYRKSADFGFPLEAVGPRKRERIRKTSLAYLTCHAPWHGPVRYDCIGILGEEITWLKDAFSGKG